MRNDPGIGAVTNSAYQTGGAKVSIYFYDSLLMDFGQTNLGGVDVLMLFIRKNVAQTVSLPNRIII